jgi:hypothetical protein
MLQNSSCSTITVLCPGMTLGRPHAVKSSSPCAGRAHGCAAHTPHCSSCRFHRHRPSTPSAGTAWACHQSSCGGGIQAGIEFLKQSIVFCLGGKAAKASHPYLLLIPSLLSPDVAKATQLLHHVAQPVLPPHPHPMVLEGDDAHMLARNAVQRALDDSGIKTFGVNLRGSSL